MLVCPSCHSTNPDRHKFCQRCGTSLIEKTCPKCNYNRVPYEAASCPNCGQFTGQIWKVKLETLPIVPPSTSFVSPPTRSEIGEVAPQLSETAPIETSLSDPETPQSPQLEVETETAPIETSPSDPETPQSPQLQVETETAPVETSPSDPETPQSPQLQVENQNSEELTGDFPQKTEESPEVSYNSIPAQLPQETENSYLDLQKRYKLFNKDPLNLKVLDLKPLQATVLSALPSWEQTGQSGTQNVQEPELNIPQIALDYLKIRAKSPSTAIPEIHDAWQDDKQVFLLLEDRSQWALLGDFWSMPEVQTTKILTWMLEMAELWTTLKPEGYCQSLLKLENIKLDEDEAVALEQLCPDGEGVEIELKALGEMWHELFSKSAKTQFLSLSQLLRSMCDGEIKDVEQLKLELHNIGNELQPTPMDESDFDSLSSQGFDILEEEVDESPTVILPKRLTALEDAGATHPGKQRPYNEDFFAIETKTSKVEYPDGENITAKGLYILCDGMGGHASGDVASKTAVKTIKDFFEDKWQDSLPDENTIKEAVFLANQELYNLNQKNASSGTGRMGTTLVMLLVHNTKAAIAHVGDSRLYSVTKQDGLQRLTIDHEVGQREIQRGVEEAIAYARPDAYQLTQALGPRDRNFIKPDVKFIDIDRDILLVLGSDGLTDNELLENYGATHLLPLLSSGNDLNRGANKLIELANEYNGHDNITAVLVRVRAAS